LSLLPQHFDTSPSSVQERITQLSNYAAALGSDLHRVSHELHPATLEQLGLEPAIRAFCRELSHTRHIRIDVDVQQVPHKLPEEVALCVYRIAQEALHNVVRHSGASSAAVMLGGNEREVFLSVTDAGAGFDAHAPRRRASLGLRSMRERVRLVNGQLSVASKMGEGTRIRASVPLTANAPN
jgi:signal transduction histidine kinase